MKEPESNDLEVIITQALEEMKQEFGAKFDIEKVNLAELERKTGISRAKLRTIKEHGFHVLPHGNTGRKAEETVISGFTGVVNDLLSKGLTNSSLIYDRISEVGYTGGQTQIKVYIQEHKDLVPEKRHAVEPQGSRGMRYTNDPGESYQMDWGFVNVESSDGEEYQAACFAMICHSCGERYIEFFPNAKQENLFIGMIHAFLYMGIPEYILTDNMASIVIRRDSEGKPIWNHDFEAFMDVIGFKTKLCKPRHPFTKGAVERLVRFVKDNFVAGRTFSNITELNYEALNWCNRQNNRYHACVDCIPAEAHRNHCMKKASELTVTEEILKYLCPLRAISFDGFVNYEGRRFGVPYRYTRHLCRIKRDGYEITVYSDDLQSILTVHPVTWSRRDSFCKDQYVKEQPEEFPTAKVVSIMKKTSPADHSTGFEKFNFVKAGDLDG